ncbi:amino acid aminotransferase [Terrimonas sp.]|uniref:aminotransferase class IV n=1 Tax=Terrimonas sp. TaxID=1914338 RepID=UPI000D516198|nr:aminotransferase class IV [Terrimonas sp.]PVD50773.1 amino acid aminotransferase [Terrimonas sp.]
MSWIYINDHFLEEDKAAVNVNDLAVQRGYGVFDFFRTRDNKPLFLDDYLDRFFNSAKTLFISLPVNREQLKNVIYALIGKNNIPESGIRITATGGYSPDGYTPAQGNLIIQQQPLIPVSEEKKEHGIKIITHEYMRDLPAVKSINYVMGVWLQKQVKEKQADDVLYVKNNLITEFPRSNIFMVNGGGKLLTPANNVLAGITRKKVLALAPEILPAATADIPLHELKNAAEVFMTSTTKRILPVVEMDGIKIGDGRPGAITKALYKLFTQMEERTIK